MSSRLAAILLMACLALPGQAQQAPQDKSALNPSGYLLKHRGIILGAGKIGK